MESIGSHEAGTSGSQVLTCFPCDITPCDTPEVQSEVVLYELTDSGRIRSRTPVKPPKVANGRRRRKSPHFNILGDEGSECDDEGKDKEMKDIDLRRKAREMRNYILMEAEDGTLVLVEDNDGNDVSMSEGMIECEDYERMDEKIDESDERIGEWAAPAPTGQEPQPRAEDIFLWSDDFTTFTGQKETYIRNPGPSFSSHDPAEIFCKIWDREIMELVARNTNRYASNVISYFTDIGLRVPTHLHCWTEVTIDELFRYFAILIIMSFCQRSSIREYWSDDLTEMMKFRMIMSRNRFLTIHRFLHFTDNNSIQNIVGHQRRIEKVAPVVAHCNRKFPELYTPSQHLSLDESLLLWKGRLRWKRTIKSKAAGEGIKSYELCESETGYLLQYRLCTGKIIDQYPDPISGFQDGTAKVILDLLDGYLDVGHVIVMDNWYNQLPITRFLKSRRTDVLGTLNRRRNGVPDVIKDLNPNVKRGTTVCRHCGDIALTAWKDVKLVTMISTYHTAEMVPVRQDVQKPSAVLDYNRYMGGVDLKDSKLSMYLCERKRNQKWYIKVFKRLFNTSLLNAYIVYTKNAMHRVYTHREFRKGVVDGLLSRYQPVSVHRQPSVPITLERLQPGNHFPVRTPPAKGGITTGQRPRLKQLRCVRCHAQKRRTCVTIMCSKCSVPLCIGKCWLEYHTLVKL